MAGSTPAIFRKEEHTCTNVREREPLDIRYKEGARVWGKGKVFLTYIFLSLTSLFFFFSKPFLDLT